MNASKVTGNSNKMDNIKRAPHNKSFSLKRRTSLRVESQKRRRSSFLNHPQIVDEELAGVILSFCDFQTLLQVRRMNKLHKSLVDESIRRVSRRTLQQADDQALLLPVECRQESYHDDGSIEKSRVSDLHLGWSYSNKYPSKAALVDQALRCCVTMEDLLSEPDRADVDFDRARRLLEVTDWADLQDFHGDGRPEDLDVRLGKRINTHPRTGKNGWNVEIRYERQIKRLVTAKSIVNDILDFNTDFDAAKLGALRHSIMCLLWSAVQPQSLQYTKLKFCFNFDRFDFEDSETFLCFRTFDNQMVELKGISRDLPLIYYVQ